MPEHSRLLILCPYPHGSAPSQRFRFEQYLPHMRAAGFEVVQAPFWSEATWKILYRPGHLREKLLGLLDGFWRRLRSVADFARYDQVFIHLEATPVGPPIFEALLFLFGKPVVYDIDDAIFLPKTSRMNWLVAPFRWRSKVAYTARRARTVVAVNEFIRDWSSKLNRDVRVIPTTIDPEYHRPAEHRPRNPIPVLGWTGTHSTISYIDTILQALIELQDRYEFELRIISNIEPSFPGIRNLRFLPWRQETEIEDLQQFDIGIMPVPDNLWSRGKVGFKAIQYAAVGLPCVVSDIGSSKDVVIDGETGFLVPNEKDAWVRALSRLLDDESLREKQGKAARSRVLERYAIPAQVESYLNLFR